MYKVDIRILVCQFLRIHYTHTHTRIVLAFHLSGLSVFPSHVPGHATDLVVAEMFPINYTTTDAERAGELE